MIGFHVVVTGKGLDAAAIREVAALVQQPAPAVNDAELYRQLDRAANAAAAQIQRDAAQVQRDAAQAQRDAAHAQRDAQHAMAVPMDVPQVTMTPDGGTTIVNPDGKTIRIEANGRVTTIDEEGRITHSANAAGQNVIPNDVRELSMVALWLTALVILGRPLVAAFGRRLDRRGTAGGDQTRALQGEMNERMQRIEQAVEAVAIEVERVSEGQRFTTKLLSEIRSPAPLAVGEPRR